MIRGEIDAVSRTRVEGWLYCNRVSLTGARVLAFVDDDCVGTGVIDLFRQDLVDKNLGDGMAGFSFSICLEPSHDPRNLDIRLDGGNALIRQRGSRSVPREDIGAEKRGALRDPLSLSWMLARGWLTQEHHEALRHLGEFGVYRQRLRFLSADQTDPAYGQRIAQFAGELLELLMFNAVNPTVRTGLRGDDLAQQRRELLSSFPAAAPVIGLWAPERSCLNVVEGSHLVGPTDGSGGGIDYEFGDDSLLWINLDCKFSVPTGGMTSALTAFVACRSEKVPHSARID